ncbi:MAG: hypothetical protein WCS82_00025 [Candidatus Riflebacteria bacterium]
MTLCDLVYNNPSLNCFSIIGLEKNSGKTTVLQSLLSQNHTYTKAVTSIGYDGEDTDLVTQTPKPSVYVSAGTLVATAAGLLSKCDFTRELLCFTGLYTPLGEVIMLRALSDGYARLAGPSATKEMAKVIKLFYEYKAEKIFIDGAAQRKSTAAMSLSDACILASGASFSHDISGIVSETAHFVELLNLPVLDCGKISVKSETEITEANDCIIYDENYNITNSFNALDELSADFLASHVINSKTDKKSTAFFSGVVSNLFINRFLNKVKNLDTLTIAALDGTRFLISPAQYAELKRRNAVLKTLKSLNLIAVTVNPFSPKGFVLNAQELLTEMQKRVKVPVFDVLAPQNI